jgi:hypothetical protein
MRNYYRHSAMLLIAGLLLVLALSACSVLVTGNPLDRIIDADLVMVVVEAYDPDNNMAVTSIPVGQGLS